MKLATLKDGSRDGRLVVVSRDLTRYTDAAGIAARCSRRSTAGSITPRRWRRWPSSSNMAPCPRSAFTSTTAPAPLPRAYQWADGSAYVNHVELVRKARGAEMPPSFWTDPLMYQGGSDTFLGPRDPIRMPTRPSASISRPRSPSSPATCRWASPPRRRRAHPPRDAGQRRQPAQPDPRTRQGLRLLPVEALDGLLAGRGDARRARRGLGRGKLHLPLRAYHQRRALRQAGCRRRHDLRFRHADRPCREDARR
jgi:hypothetical protein